MRNIIKKLVKDSVPLMIILYYFAKILRTILGEKRWVALIYKLDMNTGINIDVPQTLNEKTVWLKVNYIQDNYHECSDKYLVHEFLKKRLGADLAPKLIYVTRNVSELKFSNIDHFPCIIKVSNGSGANLIVHSKEEYSDQYIQKYFKKQLILSDIHAVVSCEHQYREKDAYIVVEELLTDTNGNLPNDYKFFYINGELQFIYCSVDRMGINVRHVYNPDWERQHFIWVKGADKELFEKYENSTSIPKPQLFDEMRSVADELATDFPMVRIDFYEANGRIYIGEITLHHGSGSDAFYPNKYDMFYGKKLVLPKANRKVR